MASVVLPEAAPREDIQADDESLSTVLIGLLRVAEAAVDSDGEAARKCLARATALLLANLSRSEGGPGGIEAPRRGGMPRWQAKRIAAYVDANLGGTIRSADLIALTPLSSGHFFRTFKSTFGESPFAYIARRRVSRAQEMMLSSNEPLSQIALACGLCDQSHLTRIFRRIVGVSPRAWRRENGIQPAACVRAPACAP